MVLSTGNLPGVTFKAVTGLLQQFRRHREITLSGGKVYVAQVGGQLGQQALHVSPLAIPGNQTMNGESVPQMPHAAFQAECRGQENAA
ncbi:MAG TPA: hypothetical protein VNX22_07270 [Acidobacteriaceae bacterium]|nr:hypothetical protein [Acidobacteriaceae bacterium]